MKILGILLFGSHATAQNSNKSDIDICIVAPEVDPFDLYSSISEKVDVITKKYDIRFFNALPLYIQIHIIEDGIVIYSPDELDLYEYFYYFRKLWADQKHRQELTREELLKLLE